MNSNERELERAGYDSWKLSNRDDELAKEIARGIWEDIEREQHEDSQLGICPCCEESVLDSNLFVEEDETFYHFSCYNYMKKEEDEKKNEK